MTETLTETEDPHGYVQDGPELVGLVMTGGRPYILITLLEPEVGGVDVSHVGIDPGVIPAALREIADLLDG